MPIRVTCRCGKQLSVKDQFAGKAVKCPGCSTTLRVPASKPVPSPNAATANAATAASGDELGDLFAEEGFDRAITGVCPKCAAEMPAGGVLCTKCGFNKQTGQVLQRHQTAGVDIDAGTMALLKAEKDLAHDKKVQAEMLGKSGMPRWMLALILFMMVSVTGIAVITMMALNRVDGQGVANPLGLFLALSGFGFLMVSIGARFLIVVEGFKRDMTTGFLVFLVPFYVWVFAIRSGPAVIKLLVTAIICGLIAGGFFAGASAYNVGGTAA